MPFWTYMLHCRGGVFYTGHTDDLERRIAQHQSGALPGFTQNDLPVELVWSENFQTREDAQACERKIKGWSRARKLALIRGDFGEVSRVAGHVAGHGELTIAPGVEDVLLKTSLATHPLEACGLLFGTGDRIDLATPCANVAPDPARHFEIDPAALIAAHRGERTGGPRVAGYWHSHPNGRPDPSPADGASASGDGRVWAIVAGGAVRWFCDTADGFVTLSTRAG